MNIRTIAKTKHASVKNRHWKEWKRTNLFLLYGSITRKRIAGIKVTYASAPAMLSVNPPPCADATTGAAVADCPQLGQAATPAGISLPQPVQNAITSSGSPDLPNSLISQSTESGLLADQPEVIRSLRQRQ